MRNFMESLFCPGCKGDLENRPSFVVCKKCGITHEIKNGAIFFIKDRENSFRNLGNKDSLIFKVKGCLKKHPKLFLFLLALRAPIIGKTAKEFIRDLHSDALVLNVGSGVQFIGQNVINVDYYPFPGVSVVADAYNLPFKDGSVDAVIAESLLERFKTRRAGLHRNAVYFRISLFAGRLLSLDNFRIARASFRFQREGGRRFGWADFCSDGDFRRVAGHAFFI